MDNLYQFINIFNKNFICDDVKEIIEIYKKKKANTPIFPENKNIKLNKYQHPLFLNYNHCLFCLEKKETKYSLYNLESSHLYLTDYISLSTFLKSKNIKLRPAIKIKDKITKRRFINSFSPKKNILHDNYKNNDSDTEIYVEKDNSKNQNCLRKYSVKKIKSGKSVKHNSNPKKKNRRKSMIEINSLSSRKKKNSSVDAHAHKKFIKQKSGNIQYNFNRFVTQVNKKNKQNDENEENIIIFPEQEITNNRNRSQTKINRNRNIQKLMNKKADDIRIQINDSDNDSKSNFTVVEKEKKNVNKSTEIPNHHEEEPGKNHNIITNFFQKIFPSFSSKKVSNNNDAKINQRKSLKNIDKINNLNTNTNNNINSSGNFLINDKCKICKNEIRDKFTLECGDFCCRKCIKEKIIQCINNLSKFDEMCCPECNRVIERNTIEKLLSEEELEKYDRICLRVNGYKHKEYIPCPFVNCDDYAIETSHRDILTCQSGHFFCKKCLETLENKTSKHKCKEKFPEVIKYFSIEGVKKCPNCNCWVQRENKKGCNNMTCTNIWCGYEFCWLCGRKYDESHYKNPFSTCFGLSCTNSDGKLAKDRKIRLVRCVFIGLMFLFVFLPLIIALFSVLEAFLFIVTFVLDGSVMKHIKLHSRILHKLFYKIVHAFFVCIGIAYIPFGYFSLVGLAFLGPVMYLVNKFRSKFEDEIE